MDRCGRLHYQGRWTRISISNENLSKRTHSALINVSNSRVFCPSCRFDFGGRHVAGRSRAEEPKRWMHTERKFNLKKLARAGTNLSVYLSSRKIMHWGPRFVLLGCCGVQALQRPSETISMNNLRCGTRQNLYAELAKSALIDPLVFHWEVRLCHRLLVRFERKLKWSKWLA